MFRIILLLIFVFSSSYLIECQNQFSATPNLSPVIKESSEGFSFFLSLWEYSIRMDKQHKIPSNRNNIDIKTLLLPGDLSMAHLVPQDGTHPLYLEDSVHSNLRKNFILDHLVFNAVPTNDLNLKSPQGYSDVTLSGKKITIKREPTGYLFVNGVRVKKTVNLMDGSQIYVLKEPLFNQKEIVMKAFNTLHKIEKDEPLGPPLDIPDVPAFNPSRGLAPPPPPINHNNRKSSSRIDNSNIVEPPAVPPLNVLPPAAPIFN